MQASRDVVTLQYLNEKYFDIIDVYYMTLHYIVLGTLLATCGRRSITTLRVRVRARESVCVCVCERERERERERECVCVLLRKSSDTRCTCVRMYGQACTYVKKSLQNFRSHTSTALTHVRINNMQNVHTKYTYSSNKCMQIIKM